MYFCCVGFFNDFSNGEVAIKIIYFFELSKEFADVTRIIQLKQIFRKCTDYSNGKSYKSNATDRNHKVPNILAHFDGETVDIVGGEPLENPKTIFDHNFDIKVLVQPWVLASEYIFENDSVDS